MSTMRKRALVGLGVVLAGGALAFWLFQSGQLGRHADDPRSLRLFGNVDIRQVELGFRVAGRLKTVAYEEGQAVTAGLELAALDDQPFQDEVRLDQAQVAEADAALSKLEHGSRHQEIAEAHAAVDEATATAQNARLSLARARQLLADGATTQAAFDDAQANARAAEARLASAKDRLDLMVAGSRYEDVNAASATLLAAQARLAAAQTNLDATHLRAPSDGVVISRVREPGAIVSPADIVYVIALARPVVVRAYVAETQLGRIHPGMEVTVSSDRSPRQPATGHIGFISPEAEFTPKSVETPELRTDLVYRLRIVVDDPGPDLRQGMPVTVQITTDPTSPTQKAKP
jgi:HlyD family secretion protein